MIANGWCRHIDEVLWSEWRDSNSRPRRPKRRALIKLSYTRILAEGVRIELTSSVLETEVLAFERTLNIDKTEFFSFLKNVI